MKIGTETVKGLWGKMWFKILIGIIISLLVVGMGAFAAHLSMKKRAEVIQPQPTQLAQISPEEREERRRAKVIDQLEQERVARANKSPDLGYNHLKLVEMMTDTTDLPLAEKARIAQTLRDFGRDIMTIDPAEAKAAYEKAHELAPMPDDAEIIRLLSEYKNDLNAS